MLTSKPLAGSVKKQAIVGADLMAMCPKVARQSAPHIQPSRPVGFRWAKICQSPDGNALFQLMCPKVSRPTVGSDPDGHTSKKETSSVCPSIRLCLMAIALLLGDWQIWLDMGGWLTGQSDETEHCHQVTWKFWSLRIWRTKISQLELKLSSFFFTFHFWLNLTG